VQPSSATPSAARQNITANRRNTKSPTPQTDIIGSALISGKHIALLSSRIDMADDRFSRKRVCRFRKNSCKTSEHVTGINPDGL
jgi:hypothetical protein